MSEPKDDGGPAVSMSLRDELARTAMAELIRKMPWISPQQAPSTLRSIARGSYSCADTMIAERSK